MTTMLNVMTRLGLPGNSTLENRYLSVDVASTVFYWDHLATQETVQSGGESAGQPTKGEAATAQVKPEPMEAIMMVPPSDSAAAQQQPATSAQPGSEAEQASR